MAKGNDHTDFFKEIGIPTGLSDELLNELKKYLSSQNKNGLSNSLWPKLIAEVDEITQCYIHVFIYKGAYKKNDYVQYNIAVLKSIMKHKNSNEEFLFYDILKTVNLEQLVKTLEINCSDKAGNKSFRFIHKRLIPMLFDNNTPKKVLDPLIDIFLLMPAGFAFDHMTEHSTKKFKNDILNSYIPNIDPVNPKSMNWWRLCKVLIHYCGRILHNEIELTNAILRIVEIGFKTKTVEDRCGSYECWKTLIDNYNLDKKYLKNSKQIRLLIKPLKAKLSRNCQVSVKRFEAYANLIEKLENFSVPCIEDFLVFCFGPLSEDFDVAGNEHLLNPGRSVVEVFPQSTEILLKLIGHQMNVNSCCLNKNTFLTDIYQVTPFLDSKILSNYATVFISCVRICSELTLQWTKENNREIIINCLWSSFFRLVIHVPVIGKREILQTIHRNIQAIIKKCDCDNAYYSILKVILRAVLYYLDEIPYSELVQSALFTPIVQDICSLEIKVPELTNKIFNDFMRGFLKFSRMQTEFRTEIENMFNNPQEFSPSIFIFFLDWTSNLSTEDNNYALATNRIIEFLMTLITSNSVQCIQYWKIATESFAFRELDVEILLLKKLAILLQSSPQHSSTVLEISWFLPKFSRRYGEEFFNNLLSLVCKCLSLPTLKVNKEEALENFKNIEEIRTKQNYKATENYFKCLEYLLKPHQVFEVLVVLQKTIAEMDKAQKDEVPIGLRDILLDLATHSDEEISGNALTLLSRLETDFKSSTKDSKLNVPMSRSSRIANMVLKESAATPIRLLGQEVESPHKIIVSLLTLPSKTVVIKPANKMPVFSKKDNNLDDLPEKDFVVIDKEVKLDREKLSVHQLENLKRKRDDIPALYQDLTQSVSQSLDSKMNENKSEVQEENKSNANETNVVVETKERKVLEKLPSEDANKKMEEKSSDDIDINKPAVQRALSSLKLDIVGADSYHQNLPKKRLVKRKAWSLPSFAAAAEEEEIIENDLMNNTKVETSSENVIPGTRKKRTKLQIVQDKKIKETKVSPCRKKKLLPCSNSEDEEKPKKRGRKKKIVIKTEEPKNENLENSLNTEPVEDSDVSAKKIILPNLTKNECSSSTMSTEVPTQESNPIATPSTEALTEEVVKKNVIEGNLSTELFIETNDIKEQNTLDLSALKSPTSSKKRSPRNKAVENTESQNTEDLIIPSSQLPLKSYNNVRVSLFRYNFKNLSPEKLSEQQKLCNLSTETFNNSTTNIPDTETLDPNYEQFGNSSAGEMDTLSMDVTSDVSSLELAVEETPKKKDGDELACSPVTKDTPNKNTALMKETCDISPIKVVVLQSVRINHEEDGNDNSWAKESKSSDEAAVLKAPSSRSEKLLNLLPQPIPMKLHNKPLLENAPKNIINISSPKTDRIRKMMMNCEEQAKFDLIVLDDNSFKLNGKDVLKFDREVPSPLAAPKISILKRKVPDTIDDGLSPCAKRKRVNFSDPPITCEKIYFKEQEENSFFKKGRRKSIIKSMSPKNDSIKSIQHQIDSLGTEGIAPLPESPPKNSDEDGVDGRVGDADIDIDGVEISDEVMNAMTNFIDVSVKEEEVGQISDMAEEVEMISPEIRMAEEFIRTIEKNLDPQNFHKLLIQQIETHIERFSEEERKRLEEAMISKS